MNHIYRNSGCSGKNGNKLKHAPYYTYPHRKSYIHHNQSINKHQSSESFFVISLALSRWGVEAQKNQKYQRVAVNNTVAWHGLLIYVGKICVAQMFQTFVDSKHLHLIRKIRQTDLVCYLLRIEFIPTYYSCGVF